MTHVFASACAFLYYSFRTAKITYREISFVLKFIAFFSILNLLTVYLFAPEYGVTIYGTRHVIFEGIGRYTLTHKNNFL